MSCSTRRNLRMAFIVKTLRSHKFVVLQLDDGDELDERNDADSPGVLSMDVEEVQGKESSQSSLSCCGLRFRCCDDLFKVAAIILGVLGGFVAVAVLFIFVLPRHDFQGEPFIMNSIVHISDFHFDKFYDSRIPFRPCRCHVRQSSEFLGACSQPDTGDPIRSGLSGNYGCDSSKALVHSAIKVTSKLSAVSAILISGDLTRHWTSEHPKPSELILDAFESLTTLYHTELNKRSSKTPVVVAWGNEDFTTNYLYNLSADCESQALMKKTASMVRRNLPQLIEKELSTMKCRGYYRYVLEGGIRVVVLNTVVYSVYMGRWFDEAPDDPMGQFAWLRDELQGCRDAPTECSSVWILGHIAPGREVCSGAALWQEKYVKTYVSILREDAKAGGALKAQFFGHEHVNSMRLVSASPDDLAIPPIIIQAAVSTIYDNRPSFRTYETTNSGEVNDFTVWVSTAVDEDISSNDSARLESSWRKSFSARDTFGLKSLNSMSVLTLMNSFSILGSERKSGSLQSFLDSMWNRGDNITMPPVDSPCDEVPEFCHLKYVLETDIQKCLHRDSNET